MNTKAIQAEFKTNFGMWLFIASEVMIFSALILLFEINFHRYTDKFLEASRSTHFIHGTVNTVILLTSSYFVALGLSRRKKGYILMSMVLGVTFVCIKATEYIDLTREGKFIFYFFPALHPEKKLFFTFYGFLTLLHAVHVIVGIFLLGLVAKVMKRDEKEDFRENCGLYWHFVDLVWVYLYPLFYLLGRHA